MPMLSSLYGWTFISEVLELVKYTDACLRPIPCRYRPQQVRGNVSDWQRGHQLRTFDDRVQRCVRGRLRVWGSTYWYGNRGGRFVLKLLVLMAASAPSHFDE